MKSINDEIENVERKHKCLGDCEIHVKLQTLKEVKELIIKEAVKRIIELQKCRNSYQTQLEKDWCSERIGELEWFVGEILGADSQSHVGKQDSNVLPHEATSIKGVLDKSGEADTK
jgi:hypothetical protein